MRVLLAGPTREREWIRRVLADAGIDIAAESAVAPEASARPGDIDAVIEISPAQPGSHADRTRRLLDDLPEPLTPRELEVLALVAEGFPNKRIAAALDISDQTVKFHVAAIIGKLGASNRTDAVRRAVRRGLVAL
jgi:DNA-binding NarL/FixJ family response regulator